MAFSDAGTRTDIVQAALMVVEAIRASGAPMPHFRVDTLGANTPSVDRIAPPTPAEAIRLIRDAGMHERDVVLDLSVVTSRMRSSGSPTRSSDPWTRVGVACRRSRSRS
jgi:hypothetical protein